MSKRKLPLIDKADPMGLFPRNNTRNTSGTTAARRRKQMLLNMYTRRLVEIAGNRFDYVGFPDSVDTRYLELTLFRHGLACFYFDADYDRYLALKATPSGNINMYGNPTAFTVYGNSMVSKTLSHSECVPMWGNAMRVPDWDYIVVFAEQLAELTRTIEILQLHHRAPVMFATDDNSRQSFANMWAMVQQGEPALFITEAFNKLIAEQVGVFPLGADKGETVTNLTNLKHSIWNEAMTFLGVGNSNQDKKERLVEAEVSAADEQVFMSREMALKERRRACEAINKRYNLETRIVWNRGVTDVDTLEVVAMDMRRGDS